jgi:hypothetical protein
MNNINKTKKIIENIFGEKNYGRLVRNNNNRYYPKILLYKIYDINNTFIYNTETRKFLYNGFLGYPLYKPIDDYVFMSKNMDNNDIEFLLKTNILKNLKNHDFIDIIIKPEKMIVNTFNQYNSYPNTIYGYYQHIHFLELLDKKK